MPRSVWKGPFFDRYLLKKAEAVKASGRSDVDQKVVQQFFKPTILLHSLP